MDFLGALGGFAVPDLAKSGLLSFGQNVAQSGHVAASAVGTLFHHSGETNRYTKSHEKRYLPLPHHVARPEIFDVLECEKYRYQKLPSPHHVRLLRLLPPEALSPDIVRCRIEVCSLHEPDEYEALSYAWGVDSKTFPLLVNPDTSSDIAESFSVPATMTTGSLYEALKRLHPSSGSRRLWIDQVCINQRDLDEKSSQVKLMGEIYERARQTVIWLGEEDDDREALAELTAPFAPNPYQSGAQDVSLVKDMIDLEDTAQTSGDRITRGQWRRQALTRFLNRLWFSRAWVFQEAVKSAHAVGELEESAKGYAFSLAKATTGYDTLYLVQHARPEGCGEADCERSGKTPCFLSILMQCLQQLQATNPHDLIYAFLAFKGDVVVEPDYALATDQLWVDTAKSLMRARGDLDVLAAARGMGSGTSATSLPSWVPDWGNCYPYARPFCAPDFPSSFRAANALLHSPPDAPTLQCFHTWDDGDDKKTLIASGKVIGEVCWLAPPNFDGTYYRDGLSTLLQLDAHLSYLTAFLGTLPLAQARSLPRDLSAALTRTLLADGAFGPAQPLAHPPAELARACRDEARIARDLAAAAHPDAMPAGLQREKAMLEACRQWSLITQRKKVFLCADAETGALDLGLAPRTVRVGDRVVLLRGSRVPCVVRPDHEDGRAAGRAPRCGFVGQCYVDGWMYGRGPRGGRWEGRGETAIRIR